MNAKSELSSDKENEIQIQAGSVVIAGNLVIPSLATGMVVFAHGSGSGRFSPRNRFVARELQQNKLATLLIDLLTEDEEGEDEITGEHRFNIDLLASRLMYAQHFLSSNQEIKELSIGLFGASTGAAACLVSAAQLPKISAVVSRGGRPDLAAEALEKVRAPTLLIVGGDDDEVLQLNRQAYRQIKCVKKLAIVRGATHLFEEPGTLEQVARLAGEWFKKYL